MNLEEEEECHYPKMSSKIHYQPQKTKTHQKDQIFFTSSSLPPSNQQTQQSSLSNSSSSGKISPAILFIIIIIAVIFFISGVLHLLVRLLSKKHQNSESNETNSASENNNNTSAFQRQLQQLFHLHDSGLDQAFIDALPVFLYKEIMGLKEPFDCAVCLCEFSEQDKLRLLPICSHAFHIDCIDTWLLSNSTCPLCRGALFTPGLPFENPVFYFEEDHLGEEGEEENGSSGIVSVTQKSSESNNRDQIHKRVFSVRLGKFKSSNLGASQEDEEDRLGESSNNIDTTTNNNNSSSLELDSRRCFSMGSYQYVVADSDLQVVALRPKAKRQQAIGNTSLRIVKEDFSEGKKIINTRNKGDSFSVSKIWQWPRKGKPSSSSSEEQPQMQSWTNNRSQQAS